VKTRQGRVEDKETSKMLHRKIGIFSDFSNILNRTALVRFLHLVHLVSPTPVCKKPTLVSSPLSPSSFYLDAFQLIEGDLGGSKTFKIGSRKHFSRYTCIVKNSFFHKVSS
jgi:hypothetical protein